MSRYTSSVQICSIRQVPDEPLSPLTIILLGAPVPWARAQGGRTKMLFTPTKQRNYSAALRMTAQAEMRTAEITAGRPNRPFTCPARLDLLAEVAIPTSWSKKKQQAALRGEIKPGSRPDLSNTIKLVEDSLNTVAFADDSLIVTICARKAYGLQPKVVITLSVA